MAKRHKQTLNILRFWPILKGMSLHHFRLTRWALPLLLAFVLTGCDLAELLADPRVAQKEADGKAIGAACRHALRGIEDCYALNEKAQKTAIFAGWREMDQYMRDNKIDGVASKGVKPGQPTEEIIEEKASDSVAKDTASKPRSKAADKAAH